MDLRVVGCWGQRLKAGQRLGGRAAGVCNTSVAQREGGAGGACVEAWATKVRGFCCVFWVSHVKMFFRTLGAVLWICSRFFLYTEFLFEM